MTPVVCHEKIAQLFRLSREFLVTVSMRGRVTFCFSILDTRNLGRSHRAVGNSK